VYRAFAAVVQLLTSFSFVIATLYILTLFVSFPFNLNNASLLLARFDYVANTWRGYASLVLIQKMPSPYHSMSAPICVSVVQIPALAATSSIYSALCLTVSLLGDAT
jgi:hypothetical protein